MAKQTSTDISEGIINDLEVEIKQKNKKQKTKNRKADSSPNTVDP